MRFVWFDVCYVVLLLDFTLVCDCYFVCLVFIRLVLCALVALVLIWCKLLWFG